MIISVSFIWTYFCDGLEVKMQYQIIGKLMGPQTQKTLKKIQLENFGISIDKNSVHGSDSIENAKDKFFF